MRVAFVTHLTHSGNLGGADRSFLMLLDGLRKQGIDAEVLVPACTALLDALRAQSIEPKYVKYSNSAARRDAVNGFQDTGKKLRRLGSNLKLGVFGHLLPLPTIVHALRKWRADCVYSNSGMVGIGALAAKALGIPHVWHVRELLSPKYDVCPFCGWKCYSLLLQDAQKIITISKVAETVLLENNPNLRTSVVYNGIFSEREFDAFGASKQHYRATQSGRPFRFGILGGICEAKGQLQAVQALGCLIRSGKEAQLVIAGSGDPAPLLNEARRLNIEEFVEFLGVTDGPSVVFEKCDATLVCCRWEAMGRVAVESMAYGLPVIGLSAGATPEIITHRETGLLYTGDIENLAKEMAWLMDNGEESSHIVRRAQEEAKRRFSVECCVAQVEQILREVTS